MNDASEFTYALPEKSKKGPPTNKNISIRNIKAQITNMSANEYAGFKNEYHVRFDFCIWFYFVLICYFTGIIKFAELQPYNII